MKRAAGLWKNCQAFAVASYLTDVLIRFERLDCSHEVFCLLKPFFHFLGPPS